MTQFKKKIFFIFSVFTLFLTYHMFLPANVSASSINKTIVVSLSKEYLTAYEGNNVILQTPITSGGPKTSTPTGIYHVLAKLHNFFMHSPWSRFDWRWYPDSFVHYGLLFQSNGYFIHDASWRSHYGIGSDIMTGTPGGSYSGTHGCINVPYIAEMKLYNWAEIGTTVIVKY